MYVGRADMLCPFLIGRFGPIAAVPAQLQTNSKSARSGIGCAQRRHSADAAAGFHRRARQRSGAAVRGTESRPPKVISPSNQRELREGLPKRRRRARRASEALCGTFRCHRHR